MAKAFDTKFAWVYLARPMRVAAGIMTIALAVVPINHVEAQSETAKDAKSVDESNVKTEREDAQRTDRLPSLADVDVANAQQLSTPEKQARSEKMLGEMRDGLRRVTEILGEARASKDIVQLNCVNEKLTQVKGLLRISEDASVKMYDAVASATQDVINHEFTKISVAHQKTVILRAEAEQCVGELSVYTGETEVTVEIDPDISDRDPTEPDSPPIGPEVPPVASGF
jgi:hypothetical protein